MKYDAVAHECLQELILLLSQIKLISIFRSFCLETKITQACANCRYPWWYALLLSSSSRGASQNWTDDKWPN